MHTEKHVLVRKIFTNVLKMDLPIEVLNTVVIREGHADSYLEYEKPSGLIPLKTVQL